ncbi:hypothetical protein NBO_11g0070 [Nosema bombycis CQ1]|uniref:Uncharacterized protein n=1 Tax=Nosema bombycis (strain CQ1 / CVCC 102059) TaxID=578461 RepID=R0MAL6_NOSB1|nr:hypothetical protein NBO_11g0070 [Nosema bombycis CQ1]|eukprot:EOB14999.1 hypothetical protein NBO_11g0070 [Nosema bombycis CQ1]
MDDTLLKYKTSSRFKIFSTFEEYLQEKMPIHAQDEEFNLFCQFISNSKLKLDLVIYKMNDYSISSLPFYVNYLFFNYKIDGFKVLVSRFNEEQDNDNKIVIYNCIRLLINHLELKDLLNLVDQGVLNILVGEYGNEKGLPIEDLGLSNFYLKFLGYFTFEEMANMSTAQLKTFIEKDIGVMKIISMCTENIFNLEDILSKDKYLRFYIENCTVNMDLLKKLNSNYNPYTLYLLFDKLRDEELYCKTRLSKLTPAKRTSLFILFSRDDEWFKQVRYRRIAIS